MKLGNKVATEDKAAVLWSKGDTMLMKIQECSVPSDRPGDNYIYVSYMPCLHSVHCGIVRERFINEDAP